jgi:hypothetical protein
MNSWLSSQWETDNTMKQSATTHYPHDVIVNNDIRLRTYHLALGLDLLARRNDSRRPHYHTHWQPTGGSVTCQHSLSTPVISHRSATPSRSTPPYSSNNDGHCDGDEGTGKRRRLMAKTRNVKENIIRVSSDANNLSNRPQHSDCKEDSSQPPMDETLLRHPDGSDVRHQSHRRHLPTVTRHQHVDSITTPSDSDTRLPAIQISNRLRVSQLPATTHLSDVTLPPLPVGQDRAGGRKVKVVTFSDTLTSYERRQSEVKLPRINFCCSDDFATVWNNLPPA